MPTTKKRINITLSSAVESAIIRSAKKDSVPVATKASELLELALEIQEDLFLGNLAREREKHREKKYSHDQAWK